MGCHFLFQGIFPTQGRNPGLPHCRQTLPSEPAGKLKIRLKTGRRRQKSNRGHDAASHLVTCICSCSKGPSGRHWLPTAPPPDALGAPEGHAWSCSFLKPRSVSSTCLLAHSRFSSAGLKAAKSHTHTHTHTHTHRTAGGPWKAVERQLQAFQRL